MRLYATILSAQGVRQGRTEPQEHITQTLQVGLEREGEVVIVFRQDRECAPEAAAETIACGLIAGRFELFFDGLTKATGTERATTIVSSCDVWNTENISFNSNRLLQKKNGVLWICVTPVPWFLSNVQLKLNPIGTGAT